MDVCHSLPHFKQTEKIVDRTNRKPGPGPRVTAGVIYQECRQEFPRVNNSKLATGLKHVDRPNVIKIKFKEFDILYLLYLSEVGGWGGGVSI